MAIIVKSKTVEWFGVYKILSSSVRSLEGIYSTENEAEDAKNNFIKTDPFAKSSDFMIETVQVKMQDWKI